MTNLTEKYITKLTQTLTNINKPSIDDVAGVLKLSIQEGRHVYIFGNGGSASTASHLSQDLGKMIGARVNCLSDSISCITAYGNDDGYENVFSKQLEKLVMPLDVVIGISCSGNSPNVIQAITLAQTFRCTTIGLSGFSGGKLKELVDYNIHVQCDDMQVCEDCHLIISHILIKLLQ